ncbi:MAG: hypothetical protein FWE18_05375 [Alphaproteobacteria bacterium]|nr:hypothetical protein [Alphaproteobacteria bacterium]
MAKILSCPNCGNNKNLNTNDKITICSKCGYSWVSVSNSNIKSSEIKVVMDSINHYKYTLNNYTGEDNTFPFYAIDNHFIESKNSNKNRLLKVHHVDEDFVNQGYVGINKFKPNSKHPRIHYDDNVDMSVYRNSPQRVVSDRSNQEYEIHRDSQNREHGSVREHNSQHREHIDKERSHQHNRSEVQDSDYRDNQLNRSTASHQPRGNVFKERDREDFSNQRITNQHRENRDNNYLNNYAERNPEAFFREYEIVKVNNDDSIEVQPRMNQSFEKNTRHNLLEKENHFTEKDGYNQREEHTSLAEHNNFIKDSHREKGVKNFNYEERDSLANIIPNPFKTYDSLNTFDERTYNANQDFIQPYNPNEETILDRQNNFPQENSRMPKKERDSQLRTRDKKEIKDIEEADFLTRDENPYLTYEEYQEQRTKNFIELKEQQKARRERLKTKDYAPKRLLKKYQRSEEKKYSRKNSDLQDGGSQNQFEESFEEDNAINYRERYSNMDKSPIGSFFNKEKFSREFLENNVVSKKLKEESFDKKDHISAVEEYEYFYNKKENTAHSQMPAKPQHYSNIDEIIDSQKFDENLLHNNIQHGVFGKNPRLSFFENLKINSDGTIKEDPLGLNQNYNEFFKNNEFPQGKKKFTLKQIIEELKKRINKDKMSFNLVVIIIIFGFFGILSQMFTHSVNDIKDEKEIKTEQDFVNQIPTIDSSPKFKAAAGESDSLVLNKNLSGADSNGTSIKATEDKDRQEILSQSKKSVASGLSLEELKEKQLLNNENKIADAKQPTSTFDKTLRYMGNKLEQFFNDVSPKVVSSKWTTDGANKYFEINVDLSNKVANKSYKVKTLEITILDISGNVIATREIHPDIIVRVKETINSTIRIPKAPPLAAKAYVKIKDAAVL